MKPLASWLMSGFLFLLLFTQSNFVECQSLSDFQNSVSAAGSDNGCESIPYSSLKDRCRGKRDGVSDYCKTEKISCDEFDPSGLLRNINDMNNKIAQLKRDRDDLQNKLSSASDQDKSGIESKIRDYNNQIQDLQNKVDSFNSRLNDEKRVIKDRIDNGQRCLEFRNGVREIFDEAKRKASSENDPAIKPLAEKLIQYWTSKENGHQVVIDNTIKAINTCKSFQ